MSRFVHTIFCDDIRLEEGNKFSLMGVLGSDLQLPSIPIIVPKFCAVVYICTPASKPFNSVKVRAIYGKETVAEMELPNLPDVQFLEPPGKDSLIMAAVHMVMCPFVVNSSDHIRIRVSLDGGREMKGGGLKIHASNAR
ncbi:DUF6941 family protein [Paramagnetospirillum marisnigri]|uniref:DUF6941 family protein n=1 Tax=Paramagnetospirillum marisnigri TaxID=1285242 RepID=UPI0012E88525|nr:hypothetical protein [Paramagnetospirillum marisnigri]